MTISGRVDFLRTILMGLLSQGLNTLSNLVLAFSVARVTSPDSYGAWAIAYACYGFALALNRSTSSTPMLVGVGEASQEVSTRQVGSASFSLFLGVAGGTVMVAGGVLLEGAIRDYALVFGLFLPLLILQDTLRYVFIQRRQTHRTVLMDALWLGVQVAGWALLAELNEVTAPRLCVTWAGGAAVSAAVGLVMLRALPRMRAAIAHWHVARHAALRLVIESTLSSGLVGLLPIALAWVAGLETAGGIRAGQTLVGGMGLLIAGLGPIMLSQLGRILRAGRTATSVLLLWSLGIGLCGLAYGVVLLFIPDRVGVQLLGRLWPPAESILLPLCVQLLLRGPYTGGPLILRATHRFDALIALSARTSVVTLLIPVVGASVWGLQGAAWGLVISSAWADVQSFKAVRRSSPGTLE